MKSPLPSRTCETCGRSFKWRKKWARDWDQVRYCSDGCRRHRIGESDRRWERMLIELLDRRDPTATICPSEVARAASPDDWKSLMEPVRRAARRLVADGRVEITQQGRVVDPDRARGPIRVRLVRSGR
ncbi:MAG: DUF2256 and DUF3253 domain-containing protein [Phycisphaera sp.]|nr:DUF2256 and DUF3253 domain-containing protein [Phycisphaera sp.]